MKTLISRFRRLFPAILVISFSMAAATAQTKDLSVTDGLQRSATFNVPVFTTNNFTDAKILFNIDGDRGARRWLCCNYVGGVGAGASITTGDYNTLLGGYAGTATTTGQLNAFVGYKSGVSNVSGSSNTFMGFDAGYSNTKGDENAFLGSKAGFNNVSGTNNTMLGADTNVDLPDLTYATAVGAGATVRTRNTIVLGRTTGADKVRIHGLGVAGVTHLCRNGNNEISTCASSLRYKTHVASFSSGLNLVRQLRPIRFEWKDGGMKDLGFGAEDVAKIEPLLVTYNDKGEVEGVKYDRIATVLVNAVKEQQAQIEAQQRQIDALKKLLCAQNPEAEVCRR